MKRAEMTPLLPARRVGTSNGKLWTQHPNSNDTNPELTADRSAASELSGASFNHLIGDHRERARDREAEGFGGPDVYDELESRGFLDRKISRLYAFQDLIHIRGGPPVHIRKGHTVGHQATSFHHPPVPIDRRQAACRPQPHEAVAMRCEKSDIEEQ